MCLFWYVLHKVADFYKLRTNCHVVAVVVVVVVVVSLKHTLQFKQLLLQADLRC